MTETTLRPAAKLAADASKPYTKNNSEFPASVCWPTDWPLSQRLRNKWSAAAKSALSAWDVRSSKAGACFR